MGFEFLNESLIINIISQYSPMELNRGVFCLSYNIKDNLIAVSEPLPTKEYGRKYPYIHYDNIGYNNGTCLIKVFLNGAYLDGFLRSLLIGRADYSCFYKGDKFRYYRLLIKDNKVAQNLLIEWIEDTKGLIKGEMSFETSDVELLKKCGVVNTPYPEYISLIKMKLFEVLN
jgi:hypothetical protein